MSNTTGGTGPVEPTGATPVDPVEPTPVVETPVEPTPLEPVSPPFSNTGAVPPVAPVSYAPTDSLEPPVTEAYSAEPTPTSAYAPEPVAPVAAAAPAAIYVQAPQPPVIKGNRGYGALIGLLAAVVFGVLYAALIYVWLWYGDASSVLDKALVYYTTAWFIVPVVGFYLGFLLLALIINRGGWPSWVYGGFVVALVTWLAAIGGALVDQAFALTASEVVVFVQAQFLGLPAIIAFVVAREVTIWFGSFVATRGAKVKVRNTEAKADYERRLAESPLASV